MACLCTPGRWQSSGESRLVIKRSLLHTTVVNWESSVRTPVRTLDGTGGSVRSAFGFTVTMNPIFFELTHGISAIPLAITSHSIADHMAA